MCVTAIGARVCVCVCVCVCMCVCVCLQVQDPEPEDTQAEAEALYTGPEHPSLNVAPSIVAHEPQHTDDREQVCAMQARTLDLHAWPNDSRTGTAAV